MDEKIKIEHLRKVFTITNAAFACMKTVCGAFSNQKIETTNMELLHNIALHELEKDKPNLKHIDYLLALMETESEKYINKSE